MNVLLTGTEYVSSIWNSAGSESRLTTRVVNKFKNILSKSKFCPVTFDTWKIGHNLKWKINIYNL